MEIIRAVKDVTASSSAPMGTCTIWTALQMGSFGMMIRNAASGNLPRAQATLTAEATQTATPATQRAEATARTEFVFLLVNP